MNAYVTIFKTQVKKVLQYRMAALSGVVTQFFFGIVRIEAMMAFYAGVSAKQDFSLPEAITYIWITQMLMGFIAYRPNPEVVDMVKKGTIAYELVRPIRLSLAWFNISLANRLISALMRFVPAFIVVMMLPLDYRLHIQTSWVMLPLFIIEFILAGFVSAAFNNLFNVMTVYLMTDDGIVRALPILSFFFTGIVVPLPLFPPWFQKFSYALPFAGFMDFPARILSGDIVGLDIAFVMLHQIVWTILLFLLADYLLNQRLKKVAIQGG